MVFLTETWFKPSGDEAKIAAMVPTGYTFISAPRTTREGGGIALFYKTAIKFVKEDKTRYSDSFEQLTVKIKTSKSYLTCVCVYRLHPKRKHGITWDQFFNDFPMFLESLNKEKELLITVDFNLHFETDNALYVQRLKTALEEHNLHQLVYKASHRKNHMLDLLLVRELQHDIRDLCIEDKCISDHFVVSFLLKLSVPPGVKQKVKSRHLKSIDMDIFTSDIDTSLTQIECMTYVALKDSIKGFLDKHAAAREISVKPHKPAPWITPAVKAAKQKQRQAERQWRKLGTQVYRDIYIHHRKNTKSIVVAEKRQYLNEKC
ncbi:ATP-dependent DNA helicase [Elysia marginata]|uniref:ATP-dependent DNA helicase n=1 Tax=Elysia marginata TaxID=1093978 RepID=A0AAV4HSS6_9GAST|nr:ATP-dependent DNA helicase [Elysia marginata]